MPIFAKELAVGAKSLEVTGSLDVEDGLLATLDALEGVPLGSLLVPRLPTPALEGGADGRVPIEVTWEEVALKPLVAVPEAFRAVAAAGVRELLVGAALADPRPNVGIGDLSRAAEAAVGLLRLLSAFTLIPVVRTA